jgi:hypothetical protein
MEGGALEGRHALVDLGCCISHLLRAHEESSGQGVCLVAYTTTHSAISNPVHSPSSAPSFTWSLTRPFLHSVCTRALPLAHSSAC